MIHAFLDNIRYITIELNGLTLYDTRPRKVNDAEDIATTKRMKADGHTGRVIARYLGVSRATLYRYLAV